GHVGFARLFADEEGKSLGPRGRGGIRATREPFLEVPCSVYFKTRAWSRSPSRPWRAPTRCCRRRLRRPILLRRKPTLTLPPLQRRTSSSDGVERCRRLPPEAITPRSSRGATSRSHFTRTAGSPRGAVIFGDKSAARRLAAATPMRR